LINFASTFLSVSTLHHLKTKLKLVLLQDPVIISASSSYHYEYQISLVGIFTPNKLGISKLIGSGDFSKNKNTE
jgi:hypothetical protein